MKLGVQLFGAMKLYNEDPEAFLREVSAAGYDYVEPCTGFGGLTIPFAWSFADLPAHIERVKAFGLTVDSCHVFAENFADAVPKMLEAAEKFGFRRFVVGWRGKAERAALDEFAARCIRTADALASHGLQLWLHNNAQEIADKLDGISAYEYILRACGGKLGAQVDTGWVACGGEDVAAFLERNADYVRSIHHKDVVALSDKPDNVALGQGVVDPRIAFDFAVRNGLGQIVDQDNTLGSLTDDLRVSADFLRTL